jgi:hypothetical protein
LQQKSIAKIRLCCDNFLFAAIIYLKRVVSPLQKFPYFISPMWPVFKKKQAESAHAPTSVPERRPLEFEQLLAGMGDLSELANNDRATKFWLPEPAALALDDFSKVQGLSASEMLRHFFAAHCYGVYIVELLRRKNPDVFRDANLLFSLDSSCPPPGKKRELTYWVPELGKNIAPFKIWIAERLRNDLQALADHVGIPLSQYLREIVISRLLGHGMVPMRPAMLAAAPLPAADDWCNDKEVPWEQVDQEAYLSAREGKTEELWVDHHG